jgi:hypothetical protein
MKKSAVVSPIRVATLPPTDVATHTAISTIAVPGLASASASHTGTKRSIPMAPAAVRAAASSAPSTPPPPPSSNQGRPSSRVTKSVNG